MLKYIYGAGGHGRVVLNAMQVADMICEGFIDDRPISTCADLNVSLLSSIEMNKVSLHLAIGDCKTRELIAISLENSNFYSVIHSAAIISKTAQIGLGSFFAARSIVAPDAKIGHHCIINHAAVVDHDCAVGDYCHIAPLCSLGGGVKVGKGVLIGAGAVVLPGLTIEDYAVIGAGAVVTKNVAAGMTVVGNPAKILSKNNSKK